MDYNKATVHLNKALALRNLGRNDDAIKCYRQAIEINPKNINAYIHLGMLLNDSDKKEAIRVFDKAITIDPQNADLFTNKGIILIS